MSKIESELKSIESEIRRLKTATAKGIKADPAVIQVTKEIRHSERDIDKYVRHFNKIPHFELLTVLSIAVLAALFGSLETWLAYTLFFIFVWRYCHNFHLAKTNILHSFISIGLVVIPLYLVYVLFNDLLGLILTVLYSLSFVIAGLYYIFHTQRGHTGELHNSFPKTFTATLFSHIISTGAATAVMFYLMRTALPSTFISITQAILYFGAAPVMVYFTLNKYFYLRFFDRVHIKREIIKGLKHGAAYTAVFVTCLIVAYLLSAMQLTTQTRAEYSEALGTSLVELPNIRADIATTAYEYSSSELANAKVTNDILKSSEVVARELAAVKRDADTMSFSPQAYLTDSYSAQLANMRTAVLETYTDSTNAVHTKEDLIREYKRVKQMQVQGQFDDGTTDLLHHKIKLRSTIAYPTYPETGIAVYLKKKLAGNRDNYNEMLADQLLFDYVLVHSPETRRLIAGDSRFSKTLYDVLYHTKLFRDFLIMTFETTEYSIKETISPKMIEQLYNESAPDESDMSSVLRNRIIKSNIDATLTLAD